ncbi:MAG: hypothetical protein QOE31_3660 [Solirubrobacteraceae bacterium]|nr:hypothetical protein [Solirubrobacteraceae bacterium]
MPPADPSFIEAGVACAQLIAEPKSWINRRVETVEMLTQEETRRRVSVDFTLSQTQRDKLATRHGIVVPISVLSKHARRNFDLRDEQPGVLPALNRADNGELGLTALLSAALDAIGSDPPPSEDAVEALTAELRQIVFEDEHEAREALESLVGAAQEGDAIRAAVWGDATCHSLLLTLASDYVLFAALPAGGPDRRVLKFGYGEDFALEPPWARWRERYAPAEIWWRLRKPDRTWFLIDCPGAWRAASFHMEIAIPEELRVAYAELGRFSQDDPDSDPEPLGRPDELSSRAALYAEAEIAPHDDVRAYVEIVSERVGGATRAALTAATVGVLLWLGWASGLDASAPGAAVSLLLAGGAVVSGFAATTGHHVLVNKILRVRRRTLLLVTLSALAASASLAMEIPDSRPLEVWLVAAIICTTAALRLGWSALRAAR